MECEIVPVSEKLISGYRQAIDTVAKEGKYFAFDQAAPLHLITQIVRRNIALGHPQYVVMHEGCVSGWCEIIPYNMWVCDPHAGTLCMGLMPALRGRGIGRRLINYVVEAALSVRFSRIDLMVRASNTAAITLYSSIGFELEGVHQKAIRNADDYEDVYSMALMHR